MVINLIDFIVFFSINGINIRFPKINPEKIYGTFKNYW